MDTLTQGHLAPPSEIAEECLAGSHSRYVTKPNPEFPFDAYYSLDYEDYNPPVPLWQQIKDWLRSLKA